MPIILAAVATAAPLTGPATAASREIHLRARATVTGAGVDLRLGLRGTSGRTVVDVRFRRAGARLPRHQRRVLRRAAGARTLTFRLRGLTTGALYGYTVGVVSGR